jgi:hypothetical protein
VLNLPDAGLYGWPTDLTKHPQKQVKARGKLLDWVDSPFSGPIYLLAITVGIREV